MQKLVIGLSALLFAIGSTSVLAQDPTAEMTPASDPDCNYVCVFSASVDELWRVDRSQSHSVEPQPEREHRATYRSPVSDSGSEILSAVARQVHAR
jgi:hypothetical protein